MRMITSEGGQKEKEGEIGLKEEKEEERAKRETERKGKTRVG